MPVCLAKQSTLFNVFKILYCIPYCENTNAHIIPVLMYADKFPHYSSANLIWFIRQSYGTVPDAGQPVSDEGEGTHEEEEDSCAVLRVAVQFPGYTHQSQKTSSFQQTNQSGGLMGVGETGEK